MLTFDKNPEIQAQIDAVYSAMLKYNPGDVITHAEIVAILGCEPHEGSWDHVVNRARDRHEREQKVTVGMEFAQGYRFLTPIQQVGEANRRMKKAVRQIRKGHASVSALKPDGLPRHLQNQKAMAMHSLKEKERDLAAEARRMALYAKPQEQMPKWRPAPAIKPAEIKAVGSSA